MVDRDTGRPRGFGFVTFSDHRAMDDAISDMHGRELDGRVIAVNKAKPKMGGEEPVYEYDRDYMSGGSYRGGDRSAGRSDCFKCGRPGHFARECPSGDGGGRFSSHFRVGRSGGQGDRFGIDHFNDRFEGAHYGERYQMDNRYSQYGNRDRYNNDRYSERYPLGHDNFTGERYMERGRNGYGRGRGYYRDGGPRGGGDRYGNVGAERYGRGSYRERPGPYDRPRRGGHLASYDRY
ncbi:glycine-rich RNA-binding protein RZ1B isoform X2 [Ziziphus jujuba]|nr:glycine-rich RNA-binding protein RZ1B isoform X2 [Ziziphus jujuba]XP_048321265.1 glycine-rich RNA-binding protein RZ1B isoform X2 [Ziziphus jujuba]